MIVAVVMLTLVLSSSLLAQRGMKCNLFSGRTAGETVTLKGEITNVLLPLAKFKSEDKEYTVHLGPIWYWKQENLKLETGAVEMIGEKEEVDGEWQFYPNRIVQGKVEIVLASDNGTPKWMVGGMGRGPGVPSAMRHGCGGCCCGRN
jgi:hypothetical protein